MNTKTNNETKPIRWGILSTANIARVCVIPAIQQSRNGVITAIASRSHERAQTAAQEFGIAQAHGDYAALIDDDNIDAIYIPLPNHMHREWAIRALEAGKHVLCEKPLALDAREAEEMVAAAKQHDRLLLEAFMWRFHPRSQQIKALVDDGALGDLQLVRAAFCFQHHGGDDYRLDPAMGGGALADVGFYTVSAACWMFGALPESVQASAVYGPTGIDLTTVGTLRFPGNRLASIEASFATALQQTYSLVGTQAAIDLPHNAFGPADHDTMFTLRGVADEVGEVHTIPGVDQYQLMVEQFADAVAGRELLQFPPSDSIGTMRVLDALAQAARSGETVDL